MSWKADQVFYFDHDGIQRCFATNLTDFLPIDAFVEASAGKAAFRVADLLQLREQLDRLLPKAGEVNHV
jgi:hypothetical protein